MSDWRILQALFARELRLVLRGGHLMPVLAFVFICVMLMPFGLGPELSLLQRLAPGLLWVIMLMAVLLSLDRMFQADFEDGDLTNSCCCRWPWKGQSWRNLVPILSEFYSLCWRQCRWRVCC